MANTENSQTPEIRKNSLITRKLLKSNDNTILAS